MKQNKKQIIIAKINKINNNDIKHKVNGKKNESGYYNLNSKINDIKGL